MMLTTNQQYTEEVFKAYSEALKQTELERMQEIEFQLQQIEDFLAYKEQMKNEKD